METQLICTACGYAGASNKRNKGNGLIELILWLFFLIPGIIYSIWRRSDKQNSCLKCGNKSMIPANTPMGQKLLNETGQKLVEQKEERKGRGLLIILIVVLVFLFIAMFNLLA